MTATTNSFSSILAQFARLQTQTLEILRGLSEAVGSNADNVTLEFSTADDEKVVYQVPSFGFIESQLNRIDRTLEQIMGLDGSDANIRTSDGSFKKIIQSRLVGSPGKMSGLQVPLNFEYKNNWFFESFLSPSLYTSVDITPFVDNSADKVLIKRMILNLESQEEIDYFNDTYKGRNNISYENLLIDLQNRGIEFFVDEDVNDLPLSVLRYEGNFDVFKYEDIDYTNPDGSVSKRRKYYLDKLTYSDILSNILDTVDLKVNDRLVVGDSIYQIEVIDKDNNAIIPKRISGFESITVGTDVLRIYSNKFSVKEAQIGLGFDEHQVVFFKSVDPNFNIVSTEWSDGIAFYSNELEISTSQGTRTLSEFYKSQVADFGLQFISAAKDKLIPSIYGNVPDPPTLNENNFKVTRINDHKLDTSEVVSINNKAADKLKIQSEISEIEKSIETKKEELSNKKFNSEAERRGTKNDLDSLTREKTSKSKLYTSTVEELAVLSKDKPAVLDEPKYRIRGFFEIPEPKQNDKTGDQNVIQFIVEYRYIRADGSSTNTKQYDFTDSQGQTLRGSYSNWVKIKSDIRSKEYDEETGLYVWADEDIENPEINNINQIDIPISKGEQVEIRVRSVSEAGWPINPILSEFSEPVIIGFPEDLLSEDEATNAIKQANDEMIRVSFQQELDARGLDLHLSRAFSSGEKYFAHDTESIASGFFTNEGNVINLFEKLKSLENEINLLRAKVDDIRGSLSVSLLDSNGEKIFIKNNSKVDIFAGYYKDFVDLLPVGEKKGAIITTSYTLMLENSESNPLELISRLPGGLGERLPNTVDPSGTASLTNNNKWVNDAIVPPDKDYNTARRYDLVPIVNNSVDSSETNNASKISSNFFQSQQLMSQFIYSRYTDVGLKSKSGDLYYDAGGKSVESRYSGTYEPRKRSLFPNNSVNLENASFVWDYVEGYDINNNPIGNGKLSRFCIHTLHPLINDGQATPFNQLQNPGFTLNGYIEDDVFGNIPFSNSEEALPAFKHSLGINIQNLPSTVVEGKDATKIKGSKKMQLNYRNNWNELGSDNWKTHFLDGTEVDEITYPYQIAAGSYNASTNNQYILPDKFGFTENDRYLIGVDTCGSYLYMAPATFGQLLVDGTDNRALKILESGESNAIQIPVLFQFRMTDFHGEGNTGIGIIGGYDPSANAQVTSLRNKINLTYENSIGLDIYTKGETTFSFDLNFAVKYRRESLSQKTDSIGNKVSSTRQQISVNKSQIRNLR